MRLGEAAGHSSGTRITNWYGNNWDLILRPVSIDIAEKIASFAEKAIASGKIGYSQTDRNSAFVQWSLHTSRFDEWQRCNADCSSFASLCAMAAIGNSDKLYVQGNSPWTGNMLERFRSTALFFAITDTVVITRPNYLFRGDILVNTVSHAAVVLDYGDLTCFPSYPQDSGTTQEVAAQNVITVKNGDTIKFQF